MIYWVSGNVISSLRIYKETFTFNEKFMALDKLPITVPTGLALFPQDLVTVPKIFTHYKYKVWLVVQWTD